MFEGSTVALVTPFKNGKIDEAAFHKLIQFHLENNTDGILVSGCTGEAATISISELEKLILWARCDIDHSDRNVFLLAGTGTNYTQTSIERTAVASCGADGVLIITPYYNKPTPEGQIAHFTAVAESTKLPVILYNVPSRTGTNIQPETIQELSRVPNIVAVKEAGGSLDQVSRIRCNSDITILSGDDTLTLPMLSVGAQGVISVTANIAPADVAAMCQAWKNGDSDTAAALHLKLFTLSKSCFIETNPIPVKTALNLMKMIENEFRLPLVPAKNSTRTAIERELKQFGIL